MAPGRTTAYRSVAWLACIVLAAATAFAQEPSADPVVAPATTDAPVADAPIDAPAVADVPPPPRARVVLVFTQAIGVDAVVSRFVNEQIVASATQLGYDVVQGEETARFAQQVTLAYPPTPADLWRLTYASGSQRGVFARVWAEGGQYVTEVLVASLDGTGPFTQRATSGAPDLQSTVHALLQQTLPPPSPTMQPPPAATEAPASVEAAGSTPSLVNALPELTEDQASEPIGARWNLAGQTESAFGAGGDYFYNHLLGARIDYRFSREVAAGFYLGYANLRGRNQRVNNALMYVQFEDRVPVTAGGRFSVPLRVALGYVPRNGPLLRLASGVFYELPSGVSVGAEVLAPTFWMIRDRVLFSLDFAIELGVRL